MKEPEFIVTEPKEPEPAVILEKKVPEPESRRTAPKVLGTMKQWMNKMLQPDDE